MFIDKENHNASNINLLLDFKNGVLESGEIFENFNSGKNCNFGSKGYPNLLKSAENTSRDFDYDSNVITVGNVKDDYVTFNGIKPEDELEKTQKISKEKFENFLNKNLKISKTEENLKNSKNFKKSNPRISQKKSGTSTPNRSRRCSTITTTTTTSEITISHNKRNIMNLLKPETEEEIISLKDRNSIDMTKCSSRGVSISTVENLGNGKSISHIWDNSDKEALCYKVSPIRVVKRQMSQSKAAEFFKNSRRGEKEKNGFCAGRVPNLLVDEEEEGKSEREVVV